MKSKLLKINLLWTFFLAIAWVVVPTMGVTSSRENHSSLSENQKIAMVVSFKGEAFITKKDGSKHLIALGSKVEVGDQIQTSIRGMAKVVFVDGSMVTLAGNTDLKIDDYAFDGQKQAKSVTTVKNGSFHFLAGKIAKMAPEEYKIQTQTATIGIRGSGGEVTTSDGTQGSPAGLDVVTIEGHVLEVSTISGEFYVVGDPSMGLRVNSEGVGTAVVAEQLFSFGRDINKSKKGHQLPFLPILLNESVDIFPFRRQSVALGRKRKIAKLLGENLMAKAKKTQQKAKEVLKIRDTDIDKEVHKPSAMGMMHRLGETIVEKDQQREKVSAFEGREISVADCRESATSSSVLGKVGREQLEKIDGQREKTVASQESLSQES